MPYRRYGAELLGTFSLTYVVWLSVVLAMPFPTPVMAAITLGTFVYTVGAISGAHLNPAVTLSQLSVKKISVQDAAYYIVAQLVGAMLAMLLGSTLGQEVASVPTENLLLVGIAEAMGTFFLAFGVNMVSSKRVAPELSGLVVGLSLFIGIYVAFPFANAVLNPAVALGIGSFGSMYILGPVVGAIVGAWASKWLIEK